MQIAGSRFTVSGQYATGREHIVEKGLSVIRLFYVSLN